MSILLQIITPSPSPAGSKFAFTPEWITAAATCITVLGLLILWLQVKADHERSRREKALDLMQFWTTHSNYTAPFFVFGRQLVDTFDRPRCESLYNRLPFDIEPKFQYLLDTFREDFFHRLQLPVGHPATTTTNQIGNGTTLTQTEVTGLRMVAVTFLNYLEIVATAWRHNVADRAIIEEEFERIFCPKTNSSALEEFRYVTTVYPSIDEVVAALERRKKIRRSKRPTA